MYADPTGNIVISAAIVTTIIFILFNAVLNGLAYYDDAYNKGLNQTMPLFMGL